MRKVLLTREGRVIVAKCYWFVENDEELGVTVLCDDGSKVAYTQKTYPTYRDFFHIDVEDSASYAEKRAVALEMTDWVDDDDWLWFQTDEEGNVIDGTDNDASITRWLNTPLSANSEIYERWLEYGARWASQYSPGLRLLWSLPTVEASRLGMKEADAPGASGSSVPCAISTAENAELNAVLKRRKLAFIFVD